jgi:hypothetical protein
MKSNQKRSFLQTLGDALGLRTWRSVSCEGCGCQVAFYARLGDEVNCGACGASLPGFGGTRKELVR